MTFMTYRKRYNYLSRSYTQEKDLIQIPESDIDIHNIKFNSDSWTLLPSINEVSFKKHNIVFNENIGYRRQNIFQNYPSTLKCDDFDIVENREFKYIIFKKSSEVKANGVIFLLHGLNEKYWDKYLPWAEKLVELTHKTVVLFPLAFHMNRTPAEWNHPRLMKTVSQIRCRHSHSITNSHFLNAAISARIQMKPQRFLWSGLQTFYDIIKLIEEIQTGKHPFINPDTQIDLFAYSMGSFLSEILLMANPKNYFKNSKLFIFCGGPTLDRMSLNSKYILDSDAMKAIHSFYIERLESGLMSDEKIAYYLNGDYPVGTYFKAMLSYQKNKTVREKRFRELNDKIMAVALKKDNVIPPNAVLNTLKGKDRDIPIKVEVMDFSFSYDHVHPFPIDKKIEALVDNTFNKMFKMASNYLQ